MLNTELPVFDITLKGFEENVFFNYTSSQIPVVGNFLTIEVDGLTQVFKIDGVNENYKYKSKDNKWRYNDSNLELERIYYIVYVS